MARPVRATDSTHHGVAYRSRWSRVRLAALYFAEALPAPPPGSVELRTSPPAVRVHAATGLRPWRRGGGRPADRGVGHTLKLSPSAPAVMRKGSPPRFRAASWMTR